MRRYVGIVLGLLVAAAMQFVAASSTAQSSTESMLKGRAVLPADTFAQGPPSGSELSDEINGRTLPFNDQPVQGISAVLDIGSDDGFYWAMSDNGYGTKGNSADFLLRMYRIRPNFKTASGGSGEISIEGFVQLSDPYRRIPFEITNEVSEKRLLTGADFDIESVQMDSQGDLWFGDEFGPFLLHTDAEGRVLEAPITIEGVKSPENPTLESEEVATVSTSRGFEGMGISENGRYLYPMLEGARKHDLEHQRLIYEFDLRSRRYTGERWWYRTESPENHIGDLAVLGAGRLLVIERDDKEGEESRFKKVYLVNLNRTDTKGFLRKHEVLDLLNIHDPDLISEPGREGDVGLGDTFAFPFANPESILPLAEGRLLVLNDNNYPMSTGRNPDRPDDTEAIIVRTEALQKIPTARQVPATGKVLLLVLAGVTFLGMLILGIVAWLRLSAGRTV